MSELQLEPQPTFALDTAFTDLPNELVRKCCVGKSCGNTFLIKKAMAVLDPKSPTGASVVYAYVREANGDVYFGPSSSVATLIECVNSATYWPVAEAETLGQ